MKRLAILFVAIFASVATLSAQNYMVVNSEEIFKSVAAYNAALTELDALSAEYQKSVDAKFEQVETMYNAYVAQRSSLPAAQRTAQEKAILKMEADAEEYQESLFSDEGTLMKRRIELISPIQTKVFGAIESYAKANGFDIVLDLAANATILYYSQAVNRTAEVIKLVQ